MSKEEFDNMYYGFLAHRDDIGETAGRMDIAKHFYARGQAEASKDILASLTKLVDWARWNTSPTDKNSPHDILVEAVAALESAKQNEVNP